MNHKSRILIRETERERELEGGREKESEERVRAGERDRWRGKVICSFLF